MNDNMFQALLVAVLAAISAVLLDLDHKVANVFGYIFGYLAFIALVCAVMGFNRRLDHLEPDSVQ